MALSAISKSAAGINQVSAKTPGNTAGQPEGKKSSLSSGENFAGNSFNDTVTLGKTESSGAVGVELDAQAVDKILPKTKEAILQEPKTAVAMQANSSPQMGLELLAD